MAGVQTILAVTLLVLVNAVYGWSQGRATYYTSWGSGGDQCVPAPLNMGSCGYGSITSRLPTGRMFAAWPDNTGYMCGKCVQVKCDPRGVSDLYGSYFSFTANVCKPGSVTVMITDNCPKNANPRWCSGDMPHLDLSIEAFSSIAQLNGIMATQWQIVSCPGRGWQRPYGCNQVVSAFGSCGGGGQCCGPYLSCQQKSQYFAQCGPDYNGNWGAGSTYNPTPSGNSNARVRAYQAPNKVIRRTPPPPSRGCKKIAKWRQCGGLGGPTGNKRGGRDGLWSGYCCAAGRPVRYNNWYWQCQ